jgi:uncharacterized protein with GYD domain
MVYAQRRLPMETYVIQTQWTDQGIRMMKESPKRLDLGKKKLKDMGGELKAFYMTLGEYDSLAIVEAPNDETLAGYVLWLSYRQEVCKWISGGGPFRLMVHVAVHVS